MASHPFPASLPVLHAAPLLHRPKGAREDRLTLARLSTECAVGRCAEGDLAPVHVGPYGFSSYHERDGALWARVIVHSPAVSPAALSPDRFASLLRDEADQDDQFNLAFRRFFARTPLAPRDIRTGRHVAFEAKRAQGEDLPPRGPGLVLEDGRERLAGEIRDFLSDEILVTEEAVYLRIDPLVQGRVDDAGLGFRVHPGRNFEPQLREGAPTPADRRMAHPATGAGGRGGHDMLCVKALDEAGWLRRHDDADLRILANTLPGWIVGSVDRHNRDGDDRGVPAPLLAAIRADAFLGMTGSIARADAQPALARIDAALRGHAPWLVAHDRVSFQPGMGAYATALTAHLRASVLPRAERLPDEDERSLIGLSGRP